METGLTSLPAHGLTAQPASQPLQQPFAAQQTQRRPLQREGAMIFLTPEEEALQQAMLRSSPELEPPELIGKRACNDHEGDTDIDSEGEASEQRRELSAAGNIATATLRYATQKRLRQEQRGEVESFLLDSALGRQSRLYVCLLGLENKIDAFKSAAPPYQVSEDLKTNINNYAVAVLLSSEISAYKGDTPRNHILTILKRFRFDLPAGIEHDLSSWEKVTTAVSYALTQVRSKVKKMIRDSIRDNTNIFALSQLIVQGTPCHVTVQLCARVSLMRAIYSECSGHEKYWNKVDSRLAYIRRVAEGDKVKITRAFKKILSTDRATYSADEDYQIGDTVNNDLQQQVDDVVSGIQVYPPHS